MLKSRPVRTVARRKEGSRDGFSSARYRERGREPGCDAGPGVGRRLGRGLLFLQQTPGRLFLPSLGRSPATRPEAGNHQEMRAPAGFLSSPHPAVAWPGLAGGTWEPWLPMSSLSPAIDPPLGRAGVARPGAGSGPRALPAASLRRLRGAVVMRKPTLCNLLFNSEEYI